MPDIKSSIQGIYSLETLSINDSYIHRTNSLSKLIATVIYIVTVVSFGRYDFGRLIPFVFYPVLIMAISETPYRIILGRATLALPFCLFAGFANVFMDTATAFYLGTLPVSFGWVSLFTIVFKAYLCVMAALLLVATTPVHHVSAAMRKLKIPVIFCMIFEMTYRYIGTLLGEAASMHMAYTLRGGRGKGVAIKYMGSFIGQLLLRSIDRAERVYAAMKCRGYSMYSMRELSQRARPSDIFYAAIISGLCLVFRVLGAL